MTERQSTVPARASSNHDHHYGPDDNGDRDQFMTRHALAAQRDAE
jgi:hypothetical protein